MLKRNMIVGVVSCAAGVCVVLALILGLLEWSGDVRIETASTRNIRDAAKFFEDLAHKDLTDAEQERIQASIGRVTNGVAEPSPVVLLATLVRGRSGRHSLMIKYISEVFSGGTAVLLSNGTEAGRVGLGELQRKAGEDTLVDSLAIPEEKLVEALGQSVIFLQNMEVSIEAGGQRSEPIPVRIVGDR